MDAKKGKRMHKTGRTILGIVILMTTLSNYVRCDVFDDFVLNFDNQVGSQSIEVKKVNFLSKASDKISVFLDKITPKRVIEYRKNKQNRPNLSTRELCRILCSFEKELLGENPLEYTEIKNLELVYGQGQTSGNLFSVLSSLIPTHTMSGKVQLMNYLIHPSIDAAELQQRQDVIKFFMNNTEQTSIFDFYLEKIKKVQNSPIEFIAKNHPIISQVEDKLVYSQKPLINRLINASPLLYNASTILPAIGYTLSVPIAVFGLTVSLVKLYLESKKNIVNFVLQDLGRKTELTKEEIVNDYLEQMKSLSKEQRFSLLFEARQEYVRRHGDVSTSQTLLVMIGEMPLTEQEKLLKGENVSHAIEFTKDLMKTIHTDSDGKSTKNMALFIGTPPLFLGFRQFSLIQLIASKAQQIQNYLIDVAEFVYQCEQITEVIEKIPELQHSSFGVQFIEFKNNENLKRLKSLLRRATFQDSASAFCNWGNVFVTFKEMEKQKEHFVPLIKAVGELDMYCGLAHLMGVHSNNKGQVQFCFAEYVQNDTPIIHANDFWNPFVLTHKDMQDIVANTLTFDVAGAQSGIFTGPNTCGKTTVIVAIMLNAILAQSFGIAAAKRFVLTPFGKFSATLTVTTDGAIGDSRFKSEVREAQKILKRVEEAQSNGLFVLTIQDEIFTGTNQRDGEVAAYNFLKKLGDFKNNITLLATHYVDKLTALGAPFANFKINAALENTTKVIRYYTVSPGISDLNIAHIIAAQAGL